MSQRSDKIKTLAETFTEKALAFVIGLPAPWTFVAVCVWSLACFLIGRFV